MSSSTIPQSRCPDSRAFPRGRPWSSTSRRDRRARPRPTSARSSPDMALKLFVGNLSFETSDEDLKAAFATAGTPVTASVIKDRLTGKSRGFGFVEMSSDEEAKRAIAELNGRDLK